VLGLGRLVLERAGHGYRILGVHGASPAATFALNRLRSGCMAEERLDEDVARPISARARALDEREARLAQHVAAIEVQKAKLADLRAAVERGREALEARHAELARREHQVARIAATSRERLAWLEAERARLGDREE
jgi:hypothetical protein